MKILIIGGSGFIGSHLCESLVDSHQLKVISRSKEKLKNIETILHKLEFEIVDITDFKKLEKIVENFKPEVIFNLAGETSHKKSFEKPIYDLEVNAKVTLVLLEKIRSLNLNCKYLLGSTFIVVGKNGKLPLNEESPCNPTTPYSCNRLLAELYCKIYYNAFNLDTIVFRITNSFGPREQYKTPDKNAVNYLIYKAYSDNEISVFNKGKFFRDFIFIDDVIMGLKTLMEKGKSGNIYWLASGKKIWFFELANILKELTGTKIQYESAPNYTKKVDVGNIWVDNTKLRSLGWNPKTSLKEGLKQTIEYFKLNNL